MPEEATTEYHNDTTNGVQDIKRTNWNNRKYYKVEEHNQTNNTDCNSSNSYAKSI
jgi:hypothetical protein